MGLAPGSHLGSYQVASLLGVGGMGEVYRARDTKLNRDVALKILPDALASEPERLARFRREAQLLASLNHHNIAIIHGLEDSGGMLALVLELVEGPTLADRIREGGIPVDEAVAIAKQIAGALQSAHEQGVVHRDLKPANIKLRPDGTVKVLDFGLAKLVEPGSEVQNPGVRASIARSQLDRTASPTITTPAMTMAGVILGTAAYMSPEQAKGQAADRRSDIWSFGCVLFEMLTGKRAFDGDDVADTLAAVLRADPDWAALPHDVPPLLVALAKRCLQKDRRRRVSDIGAASFALEEAGLFTQTGPARVPHRWRRVGSLLLVAGLAIAATSAAWWMARPSIRSPMVIRFSIPIPDGQRLQASNTRAVAISPDGSTVVYMANQAMYVRPLSVTDAKAISAARIGAETGLNPTFSPDGQSIVFYSSGDRKLKRIAVAGGPAVTLCDADVPSGINWGAGGIVFGQGSRGILRVAGDGGTPEVLARVQPTELAASPQILPGGDALLFTLATLGAGQDVWDRARIVVQRLKSGERTTVVDGGSEGRYVSTGHLLFAVGGVLYARPFDLDHLQVNRAAVAVLEGVRRGSGTGSTGTLLNAMQVGISENGSLMYVPGPLLTSIRQVFVLADSKGNVTPLKLPPGPYQFPRVSPDGKQIVYGTDDGKEAIVWIYGLDGNTQPRRLTFEGRNRFPIWSGDGQWVAFQSDREGDLAIFRQRADGSNGAAERLTKPESETSHVPESWSPKGDTLLFSATKGDAVSLQALGLAEQDTTPFAGIVSNRWPNASFSPDGKWVAYSARKENEARETLYVQPFPPSGSVYQISTGDAHFPAWSRDGRLLFVDALRVDNGRVGFVGVNVSTQRGFDVSDSVLVPRRFNVTAGGIGRSRTFDILPDGHHFIGVTGEELLQEGQPSEPQIQVVLNWTEELKQRVATGR